MFGTSISTSGRLISTYHSVANKLPKHSFPEQIANDRPVVLTTIFHFLMDKKTVFKLLALGVITVTLMAMSVGYGLLAYKLELPPFHFAKELYLKFGGVRDNDAFEQPVIKTDVSELLQIRNANDVVRIREKLRTVLWGEGGYPVSQSAKVNKKIDKSMYRRFQGLGQVDEFVLDMEYGLQSRMHLFLPESGDAKKLVIYHEAHGGRFDYARQFISPFLQDGYAVLGVSMPLFGFNNRPIVKLPNLGNIKLATHNQFMFLAPESGIPVKYFVEPVVVALNHILAEKKYDSVSMFGMSGGGWSATIAAAVDERIQDSYSVAGTTPIFIKREQLDDYEQNTPALYSVVNHFDMYILASSGAGRKHLQIHNKYDPSYHKGHYTEVYEPIIANAVQQTGEGQFRVVMDDSHRAHRLSPAAFRMIRQEIEDNQ